VTFFAQAFWRYINVAKIFALVIKYRLVNEQHQRTIFKKGYIIKGLILQYLIV